MTKLKIEIPNHKLQITKSKVSVFSVQCSVFRCQEVKGKSEKGKIRRQTTEGRGGGRISDCGVWSAEFEKHLAQRKELVTKTQ